MSTLEAQVKLLASLIERLDTVRDVSAGNLPVHLRNAITNVSALAEELASTQVQDALAASETEQNVRAIDLQNSRRNIRQRKNQVEVAPPTKRPEIKKRPYPPKLGITPPQGLTQKALKDFVLNFNQADLGSSLSIWTPTSAAVGQNGPLRMIVPNILVAYVNLRPGGGNGDVKIESVTVTGIREQRTTSEFAVFRSLSQHLFRTLAQNVDTDLLDLLSLILSYNNLYTAKCDKCNAIHSSQDNIPAIIRTWVENESSHICRAVVYGSV
ncbi:mediator complex subunit 27 [Rhizoctonia solani AG-3 Rhs1AP]|uniref:Mediator complex subunit 27 n=1 Tax=Rhizoctonia solani AG-3 Rhs1AP TaxID=1086054 RepID=X8JKT0_9AGAM|nr:mediator complex subunit 27 [Rhizoctonia solani AG-3 Rhs1AP]